MPSASMSSSTVMNRKTNAAPEMVGWVSVMGACAVSASGGFASGIRVLLFAQRQPDRGAGQIERLAQAVDEIAAVDVRHRVGAAGEEDKARRATLGLGQIVEAYPTSRH